MSDSKDIQGWLQYRGDRALTGHSNAKGTIIDPKISWSFFCGAYKSTYLIRPDGTTNIGYEHLEDEYKHQKEMHLSKKSNEASNLFVKDPFKIIGQFEWMDNKLCCLEFDNSFDMYGTCADEKTPIFGRLKIKEGDNWITVWETQPIPILFVPNVIIGDFDGDGEPEIAITPWYDVWVLDAKTGKLKDKCRFKHPDAESGRAYGWFGAYDIDGDGKDELIILSDFENHIAVIGWNNGKMELKWSKLIERGIMHKKTIFVTGDSPIHDIDNDGRQEIIVSLYNSEGDGRWHVLALDGMTGNVKIDIPDQMLSGIYTNATNGSSVIFCTKTSGSLVPEKSVLSAFDCAKGSVKTVWSISDAAFCGYHVNNQSNKEYIKTNGGRTKKEIVMQNAFEKMDVFATKKVLDPQKGIEEMCFWEYEENTSPNCLGIISGFCLVISGFIKNKGIIVCAEDKEKDNCNISADGLLSADFIRTEKTSMPLSNIVAGKLKKNGNMNIAVQGAGDTIHVLEIDDTTATVTESWRAKGTGTAIKVRCVLLADLNGSGGLDMIYASSGKDNCARIVSVNYEGTELWHTDFPKIPALSPDSNNTPGLLVWMAGYFTRADACDVLVTVRSGSMHNAETLLLNGRTGDIIWHRTKGGMSGGGVRSCGGEWAAVFDYDNDGLDDFVLLYPDLFSVYHGATGNLLVDRSTCKDVFPDFWAFYATPTAVKTRGAYKILYGASTYIMGLLDSNGNPVWSTGPSSGTPAVLQGIGDFDGDGMIEVISVGHRKYPFYDSRKDGQLYCYDFETGEEKWRMDLPGSGFGANSGVYSDSPSTPVTVDIDSDGRDECIFSIVDTLYAVGVSDDGNSGIIKWTKKFPDRIGMPAVVPFGSGMKANIVVVCADGNTYSVS